MKILSITRVNLYRVLFSKEYNSEFATMIYGVKHASLYGIDKANGKLCLLIYANSDEEAQARATSIFKLARASQLVGP